MPRSRASRSGDRLDARRSAAPSDGLEPGGDLRRDPPAGRELADHGHPPGPAGGDEVVEDRVDRVLVEDPPVPVVEQVELQALQLDAGRAPGRR